MENCFQKEDFSLIPRTIWDMEFYCSIQSFLKEQGYKYHILHNNYLFKEQLIISAAFSFAEPKERDHYGRTEEIQ